MCVFVAEKLLFRSAKRQVTPLTHKLKHKPLAFEVDDTSLVRGKNNNKSLTTQQQATENSSQVAENEENNNNSVSSKHSFENELIEEKTVVLSKKQQRQQRHAMNRNGPKEDIDKLLKEFRELDAANAVADAVA